MAYRVLVDKDVPMTTRDGVTLRADVYRPDASGRFPVLLSRLPYDKNQRRRPGDIDPFVERGYVVIMQDTRGRFASDGDEYYPLIWEAADGYDAVEWAAQLPYADGQVGTHGAVLPRRHPVSAGAHAAAAPQGVVSGLRAGRLSPVLGLPLGRGLRAGLADPLRDPHGARHHRAARAHPEAPAEARARAGPGADAVGSAAVRRGLPAAAPHGLGPSNWSRWRATSRTT